MSCCYLQGTWAVIFGWVELSAPRSRCNDNWVRTSDEHPGRANMKVQRFPGLGGGFRALEWISG